MTIRLPSRHFGTVTISVNLLRMMVGSLLLPNAQATADIVSIPTGEVLFYRNREGYAVRKPKSAS